MVNSTTRINNWLKTVFCPILISFQFYGPLFAQETLKEKVVYINLKLDDESLKDLPFFSGLTIDEGIEKPTVDFEIPRQAPPSSPFSLEPDIIEMVTRPKRENIELENLKK